MRAVPRLDHPLQPNGGATSNRSLPTMMQNVLLGHWSLSSTAYHTVTKPHFEIDENDQPTQIRALEYGPWKGVSVRALGGPTSLVTRDYGMTVLIGKLGSSTTIKLSPLLIV